MSRVTEIAILLTVFNRKNLTLKCLRRVSELNISADIYLVDDGSNDGTTEAIINLFPEVFIIKGSGDLFWNRGMHTAWSIASERKDYEFYIWLNDDVFLYNYCFKELLECSSLLNDKAIISGIIETEDKSKILYGGFDSTKSLILPNSKMQEVLFLNGNVVVIPKFVYKTLGKLDFKFHHDLGDVDYGLRASRAGIKVVTSRIPVASGTYNPISRLRKNDTTIFARYKHVYSPLGSSPSINFYFRSKHFGLVHAFFFYLFQHFLVLIPDSLNQFLFHGKYK